MRSKLLKLSSLLLSVVLLASCSYFFDQKDKRKNTYNLTIDEKTGVSCVKKNNELLRDYFNLKRNDQEIAEELREMKSCIRDTVDFFVKHTLASKETPDSYTASDIHDFLISIFEDYDFSEEFMADAFLLKQSLLGGGGTRVTKKEIRELPDFVDYLYEGLAQLSRDRHVLFNNDVHGDDWEKFGPAADKFMAYIKSARSLNIKSSGEFDYPSLVRVVLTFIDDEEDMDHWTKTFSLVNSIQSLIASGQRDKIDMKKFHLTVDNLASLYLAYAEYTRYLQDDAFYKNMTSVVIFPALVSEAVENPNALSGINPLILNSIQKRITSVFAQAADAAPSSKLSINYLDDVIETLKANGSFADFNVNPDTIKLMLPQFFNVWLSPKPCLGDDCNSRFATAAQARELQRQLDNWKERQLWINQTFNEKPSNKISRSSSNFKKRSANPNIASLQAATQKVNHAHWGDKYLIVGSKDLNFKDMVVFHDIYTLAELFLRPFNNNSQKAQLLDYFLDRDQALIFYKWFRPLGLELKLVDPRSEVDSTAAFTEINMFGSTAVDPEKMDLSELIEYFEISISTSFRAIDLMDNEFVKCRKPRLFDVFNYLKLDALCFREEWFKLHDPYLFASLPKLQKFMKTVTDTEYKEVLNSLEKAGRQGLITNEHVDTDALRQMSSILQYTESLFNRFDKDEDSIINPAEMQAALRHIVPNVTGILVTSVDAKTVELLRKRFPNFEEDLITYVIVKQELPGLLTSETMAGALISVADLKIFAEWSDSKNKWLTEEARVTRKDVLLVISGLSSLARVTKIKKLKAHFYINELEFQKPLTGPDDPLLVPLARELGCSYKVEKQMYQWLYENQRRYWNEALDWISPGTMVLFGWDVSSLGISWDDIPQINDVEIKDAPLIGDVNLSGFTKGWEGKVAYRLIELITKDPLLGPLCGVPYIPGVHRIALQQQYKQQMCSPGVFPFTVPRCREYYRSPY